MAAAREAWADSGLSMDIIDPKTAGTILGVGIGGLRCLEDNLESLLDGGPQEKVSPF